MSSTPLFPSPSISPPPPIILSSTSSLLPFTFNSFPSSSYIIRPSTTTSMSSSSSSNIPGRISFFHSKPYFQMSVNDLLSGIKQTRDKSYNFFLGIVPSVYNKIRIFSHDRVAPRLHIDPLEKVENVYNSHVEPLVESTCSSLKQRKSLMEKVLNETLTIPTNQKVDKIKEIVQKKKQKISSILPLPINNLIENIKKNLLFFMETFMNFWNSIKFVLLNSSILNMPFLILQILLAIPITIFYFIFFPQKISFEQTTKNENLYLKNGNTMGTKVFVMHGMKQEKEKQKEKEKEGEIERLNLKPQVTVVENFARLMEATINLLFFFWKNNQQKQQFQSNIQSNIHSSSTTQSKSPSDDSHILNEYENENETIYNNLNPKEREAPISSLPLIPTGTSTTSSSSSSGSSPNGSKKSKKK